MALPLSSIKGRCAVLNVKDYFRAKPEGFEDKDVYVCESRYSSKARCFKKIKVNISLFFYTIHRKHFHQFITILQNWPLSLTNVCKLIDRDEPLEPKRNVSVYRDRVEKHKEEIAELEEQEKLVEKEKPVRLKNFRSSLVSNYRSKITASSSLLRMSLLLIYLKMPKRAARITSNITPLSV